ncbi:MAG: molybdopterin biosynthesis protein, partial [Halofilum sp. (in: g-proteobacteria)]
MNEHIDPQAAAAQAQFLEVMSREAAHEKFQGHLELAPLTAQMVPLNEALGRTLAEDVSAAVDVPGFDRANVDGFALRSADIAEASPESPVRLRLNGEVITPGRGSAETVASGTATVIATGGMLPRGADTVLLVEDSDADGEEVLVQRSLAPGRFLTFAGADIAKGETVLFQGQQLGSREIGVLAAIGLDPVPVVRRPRVAILSTGDELLAPGEPYERGRIYDSNGHILAAAVRELGGEAYHLGIFPDDESALQAALGNAVREHDMVLLSGGTSKGAGDISYRVVNSAGAPGVLVHGVALKPGKPICLAVCDGRPVVVLPGFPTSAIFTFHEFVAPVIGHWAGRPPERRETVDARLPVRAPSEIGRTEYLLVGLVDTADGLAAYPMGKGSGAVTAFSQADGFVTIDALTGMVEAESRLEVQCIGERRRAADLIAVGSHCLGLDLLLGRLSREGLALKAMHVGSTGGLAVARRGEC